MSRGIGRPVAKMRYLFRVHAMMDARCFSSPCGRGRCGRRAGRHPFLASGRIARLSVQDRRLAPSAATRAHYRSGPCYFAGAIAPAFCDNEGDDRQRLILLCLRGRTLHMGRHAWAWGATSQEWVSGIAVEKLPDSVPAFVRTPTRHCGCPRHLDHFHKRQYQSRPFAMPDAAHASSRPPY